MLLAPGLAAAQGGPASVRAERVEIREITETTPILAELVATTESEVAARTGGVVAEVLFRVGDRVEQGQPLVRLDGDLFDIRRRTAAAALEAARAGVKVAEARLRLAQQAFERTSQLRGSTAFSKGQFDDLQRETEQARSELARAQAQVGQAEAELARADYDLTHATIRAPFAGVVVARAAQPGSYLSTGQAVATLLDGSALEIEANIPARLVGGIEPGLRLSVELEGGRMAEAVVRSLLPVETRQTRTRPVRLSLETDGGEAAPLAAGASVVLDVPVSAPRRAVTVPKDALVQSQGGWTVFAVEDGAAVPRQVTLGQPDGARMEVLSGLLPGDLVVVRGNERLRPGQPIEATVVGGGGGGAGSGTPPGDAPGDAAPAGSASAAERGDAGAAAAPGEGTATAAPAQQG
jgi:RND family efflux transporter MFP subunit